MNAPDFTSIDERHAPVSGGGETFGGFDAGSGPPGACAVHAESRPTQRERQQTSHAGAEALLAGLGRAATYLISRTSTLPALTSKNGLPARTPTVP